MLRPHQSTEELATHEPDRAFAVGAFAVGAFAVGAFRRRELVAVGLVGREGGPGAWRVRGMATTPEARGRGAGSAVLAALVEHARAGGADRVWCKARIAARSLYERAGFRVISAEFEVPKIGPHYLMELTLHPARAPAS